MYVWKEGRGTARRSYLFLQEAIIYTVFLFLILIQLHHSSIVVRSTIDISREFVSLSLSSLASSQAISYACFLLDFRVHSHDRFLVFNIERPNLHGNPLAFLRRTRGDFVLWDGSPEPELRLLDNGGHEIVPTAADRTEGTVLFVWFLEHPCRDKERCARYNSHDAQIRTYAMSVCQWTFIHQSERASYACARAPAPMGLRSHMR